MSTLWLSRSRFRTSCAPCETTGPLPEAMCVAHVVDEVDVADHRSILAAITVEVGEQGFARPSAQWSSRRSRS